MHAGIHPPGADTPQEQTPPGSRQPPPIADTLPLEQTPLLGADNPPGGDTPQIRHPPPPGSRHPPEQTPPPRDQTCPPPGSRLQHTVNERPVRILLECILVIHEITCPRHLKVTELI